MNINPLSETLLKVAGISPILFTFYCMIVAYLTQ